jgi:hypothetical protein
MYKSTALLVVAFWGASLPSPGALPKSVPVSLTLAIHSLGRRPEAIPEKNWGQDPKILAIRKIVSAVDAGLKQGSFKISQRKFECGNGPLLRRIARDAKGVVTWYQDSGYGESGDASSDDRYYYDNEGHLRFVLIIINAVNGSRQQLRAYFDESGKLLKQTYRSLKGPGYFYPTNVEDRTKQDPAREFASDAAEGCKEIKSLPGRRGQHSQEAGFDYHLVKPSSVLSRR